MSPETQHLESYFAPTDRGAAPPGMPDEQQEVAEFTRFFERLSSIDDMTWFSPEETGQALEPAAVGERTAPARTDPEPADAEPPPSEPASRPPQAPAQPGMQVYRSEAAEPARHHGPARPAGLPAQRRPDPTETHELHGPAPGGFNRAMRQVGRGLGIALIGSVLFAAGLGMGALVLSIPQPTTPSFESAATTEGQPAASEPAAGTGATATAKSRQAGPTEAQREPTAMVAPEVPSVIAEGARPAKPAAANPPATGDSARTTAAPAAPAAGDTGTGPRFALQVGACGSFQCVQQYRELLLGHVTSEAIQVVPADDGGEASLQRVRVEPLSRDAATDLKAALADTDARFAQAYLVALQ